MNEMKNLSPLCATCVCKEGRMLPSVAIGRQLSRDGNHDENVHSLVVVINRFMISSFQFEFVFRAVNSSCLELGV